MIGVCFKLLSIAPSLLEPGLFTKVHFYRISSVDNQEFLTFIFDLDRIAVIDSFRSC